VTLAVSFIGAALTVLLLCPFAWLILSNWLHGRALIIASVATATAAILGRSTYFGEPSFEALAAVVRVAGALVGAALVGRFWLRRSPERGRAD
jgi:hypothetical protein